MLHDMSALLNIVCGNPVIHSEHWSQVLTHLWPMAADGRSSRLLSAACAPKPFSANKLALFLVMTCLSLSARVPADPPPALPNLSSVRNGCGPPLRAVPSITASLQRPVWSFDCRAGLIVHPPSLALAKIILSLVVWKKKKKKNPLRALYSASSNS